jgi:hypothetical protein
MSADRSRPSACGSDGEIACRSGRRLAGDDSIATEAERGSNVLGRSLAGRALDYFFFSGEKKVKERWRVACELGVSVRCGEAVG